MPNTTYGSPYAQSSDLVSNWPGVSLNIADRLDDVSFKGNGLNDQTGTTYTLVLLDAGKTVTLNNASAVTVTVPTNASVAYENGTCIYLTNKGAGVVTVTPAGGVTLNNSVTLAQYSSAYIQKLDTNTWVMVSAPAPGLSFITSGALSSSATSFNNVFTSAFANYRIIVARSNVSTAGNPLLRLRLSGTDATTNYAYQNVQGNSTLSGSRSTAQTSFRYGSINTTADDCAQILDLFSPAVAAATFIQAYSVNTGATPVNETYFGAHTTATAYDGITFLPSAGNWSAGTVSIYGYR